MADRFFQYITDTHTARTQNRARKETGATVECVREEEEESRRYLDPVVFLVNS